MKISLMLHVFCSLCFAITTSLAISISKPGCPKECGNVTIPYPFGISSRCSANSSFTIICRNSTSPPSPFLNGIRMEVLHISLFGTITVNQPVSPVNCSVEQRTTSLPISLNGSPFTISAPYNSLIVLGCQNSVWLRANQTTTVGGCTALCDANSTTTTCNGVNCCQTTLPPRLKILQYTYKSTSASSNGLCGYVFPVYNKWLKKDFRGGILPRLFVPLVLDWEFSILEGSISHHCFSNSGKGYYYHRELADEYVSSARYCSCTLGYEGNPYMPEGCTDIDECSNSTLNNCPVSSTCVNLSGDYNCTHNKSSRLKIAFIVVCSPLGILILMMAICRCTQAITKLITDRLKRGYYKRNGGLLLEQHLSATENGLEKIKLFCSVELATATDCYNENRVLGHGGQGTVYKGMLTDGKIVAVKKSRRVEESDLEVFINEVVILSQINHRHVVKLLGCCLETEVPRLVYEFIPSGTLFQHIHHPSEEFPLTWDMRVRIAREVAGALAYLHSASSPPIYHRDIKSTNILLDDKYRAKVADFGTSRSISIDQTHLTTRVVGTFGYMDPEYFRSSQFTEKSDVYSFGVVMVELLTGEKAISAIRVETGRGLATHFLHSMEENQLFEILDARVLEVGKKEEIEGIAELARRCLNLNGRRRPTMKEVAAELEGIQMVKEGSEFVQNEDSIEHDSIDFADSSNFSSITESMHFDTITTYVQDSDPPTT